MKELETVQAQLPPSLHISPPTFPPLRPEEEPEKTREYSRESLLQFAAEKEERERLEREAAAGVGEGFGGFGGFGGGGEGGEQGKAGEGKEEGEGDEEKPPEEVGEIVGGEEAAETEPEGDGQEKEEEEGVGAQLSELGLVMHQEQQVHSLPMELGNGMMCLSAGPAAVSTEFTGATDGGDEEVI